MRIEETGIHVYNSLKSIDPYVKVYPIIAEEGATYPFITYQRTGSTHEYTKDLLITETSSIQIQIAAQDYKTSVTLTTSVRDALANGNTDFFSMQLSSMSEEYREDAFVQTLIYEAEVVV